MPISARQVLANVAIAHSGCSAKENISQYLDLIARPSDRNPRALSYFLGHGGSPPSTCALAVLGVWRLAGMTDRVLLDPYKPGNAMTDVQTVGSAHGALTRNPGTTSFPLTCGDSWIIDNGTGMDAHAGICVSDAVQEDDGSFTIDTVEGGQGPDSSAVGLFGRNWKPTNGRWYCGTRFLICSIDASKLGIPNQDPA